MHSFPVSLLFKPGPAQLRTKGGDPHRQKGRGTGSGARVRSFHRRGNINPAYAKSSPKVLCIKFSYIVGF